ncbi:MAG TPA: tautomerase family protein [Xanthobacteraceae bacterium]|nr:tautomerase family protein [Xanthobacteraceae bacterium]
MPSAVDRWRCSALIGRKSRPHRPHDLSGAGDGLLSHTRDFQEGLAAQAEGRRPSTKAGDATRLKSMEAVVPLVRIDVSKDAPSERIKAASEAIYGAMVEIANAPLHDKFQVVTRHAADEIIYPKEGYLGLTYTGDLILIQITWIGSRSIEVKKKFYQRIADEIHERTGVRKEDVWINLVDDAREDWSFGSGAMQYGPK